MRPYGHGFVLGKFYPPHLGHHYLIQQAATNCHDVTVLVMASQVETISLEERVEWMRTVHGAQPNVRVLGITCDIPVDINSDVIWAAHLALMRAALVRAGKAGVDAVFSSEAYGDELAVRLGAVHVRVDPERTRLPVSSTLVRENLTAQWHWLDSTVKQGLVTRIVVVGAECTGTTTVSRALAEAFRSRGGVWASTQWVSEFGRDYTASKWDAARAHARALGEPSPCLADLQWSQEDFALIGRRQREMEDAAAACGSPVLVCDTDEFATSVWTHRYLGVRPTDSHDAALRNLSQRRVYLLTDHCGVPFEQDGLRDGEHIRSDMTDWFIDALTLAGHSWVLLTGSIEDRTRLAIRIAEQMLARRAHFAAPLG